MNMRHTKDRDTPPMSADLAERLYATLDAKYPGKVWRVIEVCPAAVVKTIDNTGDALETLRRFEDKGISPSSSKLAIALSEARAELVKRRDACQGNDNEETGDTWSDLESMIDGFDTAVAVARRVLETP